MEENELEVDLEKALETNITFTFEEINQQPSEFEIVETIEKD